MITILYNSQTQQISRIFNGGYTIDGQHKVVSLPFYELEYVDTADPEYDPATQKISYEWVADTGAGTYTKVWTVADKTASELEADAVATAEQADAILNAAQVKAALRLTTDTLTEGDLTTFTNLYPYWAPGVAYVIGDKVGYGSDLYKVVQAHTSQLDWTPDIVPALFTKIAPEGVVPDWVQPTGAQDAYNIGDRVRFEGHIYESLINANVWSPTVYPAGWSLIE